MCSFLKLFDIYNPDEEKSRILNTALIYNVTADDDGRRVEVGLSFNDIVKKSLIYDIQNEIKDLYGFDDFKIKCKFPADKFGAYCFDNIFFNCKNIEPLCNGFFSDCEVDINDNNVNLTLRHGGLNILKLKQVDLLIERIIYEEFGRKVKVNLIEGEKIAPKAMERDSEEAIARAKIVRKLNDKKTTNKDIIKAQKANSKGDIIYGSSNSHKLIKICDITSDTGSAAVIGRVMQPEKRTTKQGKWVIFTFGITDLTSSIKCKLFLKESDAEDLWVKIKENDFVKVSGDIVYDKFDNELIMTPKSIMTAERIERCDNAENKRIELHLHTNMSQMDGVTSVKEYIKTAKKWGYEAIAITDHGVLQAYPAACTYAEDINYEGKIIYGVEAYFVNDTTPAVFGGSSEDFSGCFVVFDIETTGFSPETEYITEIGAVKIENGVIKDKFNTFAKPLKPIPKNIVELTGITDSMVENAPSQEEAVKSFLEFAGNCPLIAHNVSFDISFIRAAAQRFNLTFKPTYIDTVTLARRLYPKLKNHKLNTIADELNVGEFNHHRASDDAGVLAKIFNIMCEKMAGDYGINNIGDIDRVINGGIDVKKVRPYHQIILVKNKEGLKNLFKLVSKSNLKYYYKNPRIPKSELLKYREGLIIGSACEAGELYQAILEEKTDSELTAIASFYDYLEIQPLANNKFLVDNGRVKDIEELKEINRKIVKLGEKLNKPVVATCDVHFLNPEDEIFRKILLHVQKFSDADKEMPLYLRTTEEMLEEFSYLGEETALKVVIENPKKIADMCEKIWPLPPKGVLYKPELPGVEEEIKSLSYTRAREIYGENLPEIVEARLKRELDSIIKHGYAVIYMIAQKLVTKSLSDGYLVGSRGSVGSSFVANMAGITEVNSLAPHYVCSKCKYTEFIDDGSVECGADLPDKACPNCGNKLSKSGFNIPFETFLGFEADKVPDIDLNFSGDYQPKIHKYVEELLGSDKVFRAGTVGTVADKTAYGFVKNYVEAKGITLPEIEMRRLAAGCEGVKRTTGQHPGGLMVVPASMDIHDFTPVQHPADDSGKDVITTHFEYKSIHDNILKLDLLGHDDPTVIRMLSDLTGIDARTIPLDDKKTMSLFSSNEALGIEPDDIISSVGTLGIPEFGTKFVRGMLEETHPTTFGELVRISGLSHGTDVWLGNAAELIENGTATLKEVICTRDDIMTYLIHKGLPKKLSFTIMESVRKGKGLKDEWVEEMKNHGVPDWYISSCKKIKYMFPRAHAVAYVTMAYRIAWFKINFPLAFYATYFTVRADDFNAESMCYGIDKVYNRLKEIEKIDSPTAKEKNEQTILEVCYEFYKRGFTFEKIDLYNSHPSNFLIASEKSLLPPFNAIAGLGLSAAQSVVKAREEEPFLSVEDLSNRTSLSKTIIENMYNMGILDILPKSTQMSLF